MILTPTELWLGGGLLTLLSVIFSAIITYIVAAKAKVNQVDFKDEIDRIEADIKCRVSTDICSTNIQQVKESMAEIKAGISELKRGMEETLQRIARLEARHGNNQ